ncbi:MAG: ABC transporter ATP-binding protein/permease [Oscillospiraceae bacterium]|nr:ABC transporter ATP-binding protein/permease [Oscillospiraceae bacterium]
MIKNFRTLLRLGKPSKLIVILSVVCTIVASIAGVIIPLLLRTLIDGGFEHFSLALGLQIAGLFVIQLVLAGLSFYLMGLTGNKMIARVRQAVWEKMIYLPIPYFSKTISGESASRIVNDTSVVRSLITDQVLGFIQGVISLVASVLILFILDWQMTLIIVLAVPLTVFVIVPLGKIVHKISVKMQDKTAELTGLLTQVLTEMRLVKASNAELEEIERQKTSVNSLLKYGLKEVKIYALLQPVMQGMIFLVIFGVIAYGGLRVSSGTLSTGTLFAFIMYLFQIIMPVAGFGMFFAHLQKANGASERLIEILNEEGEDLHRGHDVDLSDKPIIFDNVTFNYDEDTEVLKHVSFKANPNETIAFAGPSGGGKTTIFSLIERFFQLDEGRILLDDMNIEDISLRSWRSQIGYVPQETSLFVGSIKENLCYGLEREVSEEELWHVVELACAKDVIENLPDQFESLVGERGLNLSGGQRQRLAIARAFLRNPKILLLDEATASLDSQSEAVVQEALANLMKGRTTFVIAHRLSTIVDADQIVFVEDGQVTGIGTHEELSRNHNLYAEFAAQQFSREEKAVLRTE